MALEDALSGSGHKVVDLRGSSVNGREVMTPHNSCLTDPNTPNLVVEVSGVEEGCRAGVLLELWIASEAFLVADSGGAGTWMEGVAGVRFTADAPTTTVMAFPPLALAGVGVETLTGIAVETLTAERGAAGRGVPSALHKGRALTAAGLTVIVSSTRTAVVTFAAWGMADPPSSATFVLGQASSSNGSGEAVPHALTKSKENSETGCCGTTLEWISEPEAAACCTGEETRATRASSGRMFGLGERLVG
jgi:hypothetical protein